MDFMVLIFLCVARQGCSRYGLTEFGDGRSNFPVPIWPVDGQEIKNLTGFLNFKRFLIESFINDPR